MSVRLSLSNLAFAPEVDGEAFDLLRATGIEGVEVAPTRIAPWEALDAGALDTYRRALDAAGLTVSSLQAIFYGCPQAQLLGDEDGFAAMLAHVKRVGLVAEALGAGVAVFGSPNNRKRGGLSEADAMALAAERLRALGEVARPHGLLMAMEPVPPVYGADFLNGVGDAAALVALTDHPAIALHLDCSCIGLNGDDPAAAIARYGGIARHYHAAEPDLGPFAAPRWDHAACAVALAEAGYAGWVAAEMRQQGKTGLPAVREAAAFLVSVYGSGAAPVPPR